MRNNHVDVSALTRRELEAVIAAANFTEAQQVIFDAMNKDYMYDLAVMQKLGLTERSYYKIKKTTVEKIERIVTECGYSYAIKATEKRHKNAIKTP